MTDLISTLHPTVAAVLLVVGGFLAAAWGLRLACGMCGVDPPRFSQAGFIVVLIVVVNFLFISWFEHSQFSPGLGMQLAIPLAVNSAILAMYLSIGIANSVLVSVVHGGLCAVLYIAMRL